MRLLVISAAFPPMRAGEADHVFFLCQRLAHHGATIDVLTTKKEVLRGAFPFEVHPLLKDWSWASLPRLVMFVRRSSPDAVLLVHSDWVYEGHPMIAFAPAVVRRLLPRACVVTQLETESFSLRASLPTRALLKVAAGRRGVPSSLQFVLRSLVCGSDRVIVLSEHHRLRLLERFPAMAGRIFTIPPPPLVPVCSSDRGEPRARTRERLGLGAEDFVVVYFGFVDPTKGVETLLAALQVLARRNANVRLLMVGGGNGGGDPASRRRLRAMAGYEEAMRRLPDELGIGDRVTWTGGYTSDSDDASAYLRAADACALPYDKGIMMHRSSFAAAVAHGVPVVTTRGPVLEPAFVDGRNVVLCPPKDPARLAAAIQTLIDSVDLRQTVRSGGLDLARSWFCWEHAVARTMEALGADQGHRAGHEHP